MSSTINYTKIENTQNYHLIGYTYEENQLRLKINDINYKHFSRIGELNLYSDKEQIREYKELLTIEQLVEYNIDDYPLHDKNGIYYEIRHELLCFLTK